MSDEDNQYDHIVDYIRNETRVGDETRMLISDFAILWNKYEKTFHYNNQQIKNLGSFCSRILEGDRNCVNDEGKAIISELYESLVSYIKTHYGKYECSDLKKRFEICRPKRDPNGNVIGKPIEDIGDGDLKRIMNAKTVIDKLHFLLLIITRVRNNMFHGVKDTNNLGGQNELFVICNKTLHMMLTMKGNNKNVQDQ